MVDKRHLLYAINRKAYKIIQIVMLLVYLVYGEFEGQMRLWLTMIMVDNG